jgi:RHS repeat-associated protein
MLAAAKEKTLAPLASAEEIFSLAAGVDVAALETHQGENAARGKKPHQGIFSKKRKIAVGATWAKWLGTHQDSGRVCGKTVLGSALDANGNTLSDPSGKSYSWDFENRLTQAVVPGTNGGTTRYDPFGRRIQKSGPLGTTNYLYDGKGISANVIEAVDNNGNILARYTQSMGADQLLAEIQSGVASYYQQDGLSSVTSLSNSSATLADTYTYNAFGKLTASTGTLVNPFQYTGRESDPETSLDYYRSRYYDPNSGRFLSEDPMMFDAGTNFYPYVANNPANMIDPLGLQHTPGGPWHPEGWISYSCSGNDSCATLSWKIGLIKAIIAGHLAWDAARGVTTHTDNQDIPNHQNALNNCIELHQKNCTNNCPKFEPAPAPSPTTTIAVGGGLTVLLYIILIAGAPAGF